MQRFKVAAAVSAFVLVGLCVLGRLQIAKQNTATMTPTAAEQARAATVTVTATPRAADPTATERPPAATNTSAASKPTDPPRPANTPRPTRGPVATRTLAQDLAIINETPNDPTFIRRANELLTELDAGFPETEREIGDLTAQAHAVLIDKGKPVGIIEIMEEMQKMIGAAPGLTYKDAIIGWMILMTS